MYTSTGASCSLYAYVRAFCSLYTFVRTFCFIFASLGASIFLCFLFFRGVLSFESIGLSSFKHILDSFVNCLFGTSICVGPFAAGICDLSLSLLIVGIISRNLANKSNFVEFRDSRNFTFFEAPGAWCSKTTRERHVM